MFAIRLQFLQYEKDFFTLVPWSEILYFNVEWVDCIK